MKTGIELIAQERQEQIEKHGWNIEKDACYRNGELIQAALFCIDQERFKWPRKWILKFRTKILHKTRIDQLKVAGALIAAEIDRLLYIASLSKSDINYLKMTDNAFDLLRKALQGIHDRKNEISLPDLSSEEYEPTQSVCPKCGELHDNEPFVYCPICMDHYSAPKKFDFRRIKVDFVARTIRQYWIIIPSINIASPDLWQTEAKYGIAIEFRWIIWGFGWRFYNEVKTK